MNFSSRYMVGVLLQSLCCAIFAVSQGRYDPCPAFTDSLVRCLIYDTNDTFDGCSACVLGSVPDGVASCGELKSHLCEALSTCPCSICRREYAASLRCLLESKLRDFDCQLECPDLGEDGRCSTSNDPVDDCNAYRVQAARCYVENNLTMNDSVACHTCIFNDIHESSRFCNEHGLAVCTAISSCPCEPCESAESSYWSCVLHATQNCTLPCSLAPSTTVVASLRPPNQKPSLGRLTLRIATSTRQPDSPSLLNMSMSSPQVVLTDHLESSSSSTTMMATTADLEHSSCYDHCNDALNFYLASCQQQQPCLLAAVQSYRGCLKEACALECGELARLLESAPSETSAILISFLGVAYLLLQEL